MTRKKKEQEKKEQQERKANLDRMRELADKAPSYVGKVLHEWADVQDAYEREVI